LNLELPIYVNELIPKSLQTEIRELFLSTNFPWYYVDGIWGKDIESPPKWQYSAMNNPKVIDSPGFAHLFCEYGNVLSQYYPLVRSVLHFLEHRYDFEVDEMIRVRSRLTVQTPNHNESTYSAPHFDFVDIPKYYTFVYYVNDSDGDTILFKEKINDLNKEVIINPEVSYQSTPKQGCGIFFPGNVYHSGNFPIKNMNRIIINYDFTVR